jgi:hypothetical protein
MWNANRSILALAALGWWWVGTARAARLPEPFVGDYVVPVDQKELDKFCKRHNAVTGDLIFGPDYPRRDLSAVSCIHRVDGRVVIKKTPNLETLDGLRLDAMAGVPLKALRIVDNNALVDVSGLTDGLELRAARIVVQGNGRLQTIDGLPDIVGGADVTIADNVDLVELVGPNGNRRSTRLGQVYIGNNARLVRVTGFDRVVAADAISVRANARLRELHGFARLTEAGTFEVVGHPLLVDWSAAPTLSTMKSFVVEDCDGLETLPGFPDLTHIGSVRIVDNITLNSVAGLTVARSGHPTVDQLVVTGNPNLTDRAVALLLDRLHLPANQDAVRVEGNGTASRPAAVEPWDADRRRELTDHPPAPNGSPPPSSQPGAAGE